MKRSVFPGTSFEFDSSLSMDEIITRLEAQLSVNENMSTFLQALASGYKQKWSVQVVSIDGENYEFYVAKQEYRKPLKQAVGKLIYNGGSFTSISGEAIADTTFYVLSAIPLIKDGKPPAMPGRRAEFDRYGKMKNLKNVNRSKFNIKEVLHEQYCKFSPHAVGM